MVGCFLFQCNNKVLIEPTPHSSLLHNLGDRTAAADQKMVKRIPVLLIFVLFSITFCHAAGSTAAPLQPHALKSFKPKAIQQAARSCPYTVVIRTSCSSPSYTRDRISLAFGDAFGNEVYAKRLDDPSSRTFERCSKDTFQIAGPCTYDICYLHLLRKGSDGWKPESVKVYGQFIKTVNFYYNTFLPDGVWYGFNLCRGLSATANM